MSEPQQQGPRVVAIHVAPARRLPMQAREAVEAETALGLMGDRYHGSRDRHVSIQSASQLTEAPQILGRPIDPGGTRRNITISEGEIPNLRGHRLIVGTVVLEVFRMAAPCRLLDDEIGPGAAKALRRRVRGSRLRSPSVMWSVPTATGSALASAAPCGHRHSRHGNSCASVATGEPNWRCSSESSVGRVTTAAGAS